MSNVVENDVHLKLNASFSSTTECQVLQAVPTLLSSNNLRAPYSTTTWPVTTAQNSP